MLIYISHKTATYIFQKLRLVYRTNRDLYRTKLPFIHRTNCNLYIAHSATYISYTLRLIYHTNCNLYIAQTATYISHTLRLIYRTNCDLYIAQTAVSCSCDRILKCCEHLSHFVLPISYQCPSLSEHRLSQPHHTAPHPHSNSAIL